jgi:hypothetical protein
VLKTFAAQEVTSLSSSAEAILKGKKNEVVGYRTFPSGRVVDVTLVDSIYEDAEYVLGNMPAEIVVPLLKESINTTTDFDCRLNLYKCLAKFKNN